MPRVVFASPLSRFADRPTVDSTAGTLAGALAEALAANPALRERVLDDAQQLLPNVVMLVDGRRISAGSGLAERVGAGSTVQVLLALSGG